MKRVFCISILIILTSAYIVSVGCLNDVKILAGNVTPIVNLKAMWVLVTIGLIAAISLFGAKTQTFLFLGEDGVKVKKRHIYILLVVLILFKVFGYILSPKIIQYMRVWPDSTVYLSDMQRVLGGSVSIFDCKSPVYTVWLLLNHLVFGKIIGSLGGRAYFDVMVSYSDIIPPIILQNILGIFSALICYYIFSRLNSKLAFIVTILVFLSPTTLAIENAILRESLSLFFILSGFALFIKAVQNRKFIYSIMSGVLFGLAYQTRHELIIIYMVLCFMYGFYVLLWKHTMWRNFILFCLPLFLGIYFSGSSMNNISKNYCGRFNLAVWGLKSECYFYESHVFPGLIENIQKRVIQCKKERFAPCETPAPSIHVFMQYLDEETEKYIKEINPNIQKVDLKYKQAEVIDKIFIDIIRNNTFYYIKSIILNFLYNLFHNVHNMIPILYDGDDYWISENWNYYECPKMLVLYEKDRPYNKYFISLFRILELYTVRKILFPFFFIGSVVAIISVKRGLLINSEVKKILIVSVLLISWIHLLFLSAMANPVARYIFPIFPFIFAIEIIGVMGVYHWLRSQFWKRELKNETILIPSKLDSADRREIDDSGGVVVK